MTLLTIEQVERLPRIKFPAGNSVRFLMDFGCYKGLPSNLDFYVVGPAPGNLGMVELVARGYGIKGDYGSGSIFMKLTEQPREREEKEIPGKLEWYEDRLLPVVDASRSGWWRFHEHYDRNGYCDNPARGY